MLIKHHMYKNRQIKNYLEKAPDSIKEIIKDQSFQIENIGMSKATILIFHDYVLKIQPYTIDVERELRMLTFLHNQLPVPKVISEHIVDDEHYMLMSKIPGHMACSKHLMQDPKKLMAMLVKGLNMFWHLNKDDCPIHISLLERIDEAEKRYLNHQISDCNINGEYLQKFNIENVEDLFNWLRSHVFDDELYVSHGDYCLPNIFIENENITGFIDLGRSGLASKWQDIALCYRSLVDNFEGIYQKNAYYNFNISDFFHALNIKPDWDKIWFYILLDELL